jgi:hypothetical protein
MVQQLMRFFLVILGLFILVGCATQPNVALSEDFWRQPKQKIVVAATQAPEPQLYMIGGQGLLDLAVAKMANNSFEKHINHADLSWYYALPMRFTNQLKQRKMLAHFYPEKLNDEKQSYSRVSSETNSNALLIIKLNALGASRRYSGFIPIGAPQAYCVLQGELINTQNDQVLWRHEVRMTQAIQGEWDQSPSYPNFNNALKLAVRSAQEELLDSFFSG